MQKKKQSGDNLDMQFKITLATVEDIERFRTKIAGLEIQMYEFQYITLRELAKNIILRRIHIKMKVAGFSQKIIDGTFIDNIEIVGKQKARLFFRSEYFEPIKNFDVALGREEGTKRHFIKPVVKKALYGGQKWPYFSKGHWVSGVPRLLIMKDTVKEMQPELQDQYNKRLDLWIAKNLEGVAIAS